MSAINEAEHMNPSRRPGGGSIYQLLGPATPAESDIEMLVNRAVREIAEIRRLDPLSVIDLLVDGAVIGRLLPWDPAGTRWGP